MPSDPDKDKYPSDTEMIREIYTFIKGDINDSTKPGAAQRLATVERRINLFMWLLGLAVPGVVAGLFVN